VTRELPTFLLGLAFAGVVLVPGQPAIAQPCTGDCGGDFAVAVNEILFGINVALGRADSDDCPGFRADGRVTIAALLKAVVNALQGCREAPELGALVSGTAAYVNGTYVWTDYAYDDRGANRDAAAGGDRTDSARAGGDVKYPPELAAGNAADLIQLQLGLDGGALTVRAILQTLTGATVPLLGIAFDTDANPASGAATLPGDQWPTDGPLGVEVLLTFSSRGGESRRFADGVWSAGGTFAVVVDPQRNVIDATVPRAIVDPGRATWRVFAALGIRTANGSWLDGGAPIFDLAFVGPELLVRWQENEQADILAGVLDSERAAAHVDFARVADGVSESPPLTGGRFHTFMYHSVLDLPEGIETEQDGNHRFLGPYQPYAVFIPEEVPDPTPLAVFLHGLQQNHLGAVFVGDAYLGTGRALSEDPFTLFPMFSQDGFDFPPATVQVQPLARGEGLGYAGIAHQDVLEVLADAQRRFAVDENRVTLQGASMGGIGTYRIGALEPDRWSAIVPLIGFQRSELLPLSANLLNVPVRQINGAVDPLIPEPPATASAARLDELGYDYRYWLIEERGHEAGGFIHDCVFGDVAALRRTRNPARIHYTVDPSLDVVDPESGLTLRFDSAYWVSDIRVRDPGALGSVDATSFALPRFEETINRIDAVRDNVASGADLCGPNPAVQTGETWRERGIEIVRGEPLPASNELSVALTNVGAVKIEVDRAGVNDRFNGSIDITTDGAARLALVGLRPEQPFGGGSFRADRYGRAVVELSAGRTVLALRGLPVP
jgi:hypothetical protein